MILLLDNYDSFVHNLARYLRELEEEVVVRRNDRMTVAEVRELGPDQIVLSPGPCTPAEAGISTPLIRELPGVPFLGVCLGHQCIGEAFGARVRRARRPMHGKSSAVRHRGEGLFSGFDDPFEAVRYHSLVVAPEGMPDELEVTAWTDDGEVMGLRHRDRPVWGVQFHPEAVLTEGGHGLLSNFVALSRGVPPPGPGRDARSRELVRRD